MPVLAWLGSFLASALAKSIFDKIVMFLAIKTILTVLFIVVLPIVLHNLIGDFMEILLNYASSAAGPANDFQGAMAFSGFCAWLLDCFQIPACISLLISGLQFRLVLTMIPFVGLKS